MELMLGHRYLVSLRARHLMSLGDRIVNFLSLTGSRLRSLHLAMRCSISGIHGLSLQNLLSV